MGVSCQESANLTRNLIQKHFLRKGWESDQPGCQGLAARKVNPCTCTWHLPISLLVEGAWPTPRVLCSPVLPCQLPYS